MGNMKELVEDYNYNIEKSDRLHRKLIQLLDYNTQITAAYGHNTGGTSNNSSKVERLALKIKEVEDQIIEVERKIYTVNIAERILNNQEREIINLIKQGYRNRITKMAKILHKDKDYVYNTRKTALKKMDRWYKSQNVR